MTKEEAINLLADMDSDKYTAKEAVALTMAIKALEQEPCEDTISRQAVDEAIYDYSRSCDVNYAQIMEYIDKIPSVNPQPKTGWISVSERLPEEREWYLAVFKEKDTGFQLIPRVADYIGKGENKWRIMDDDSFPQEYLDLLECVAWQPLPEPYEPQESEEA